MDVLRCNAALLMKILQVVFTRQSCRFPLFPLCRRRRKGNAKRWCVFLNAWLKKHHISISYYFSDASAGTIKLSAGIDYFDSLFWLSWTSPLMSKTTCSRKVESVRWLDGDWKNTHRRFCRWRDKKIWAGLLDALISDPDFEWLMIDAMHTKVHTHAAGAKGGNQAMGVTKGGWIVSGISL